MNNLSFLDVVERFQTLITGLLAVVAAIVTIYFIRKQIVQVDQHSEEARYQKSKAARAFMPNALSALCEYANESIIVLIGLRAAIVAGETGRRASDEVRAVTVPIIPHNALSTLKECIEFSYEEPAGKIAHLIRELQIQNSRLRTLISDCQRVEGSRIVVTAPIHADSGIFDAANIYALAENLFEFARSETESAPNDVNVQDVKRALFLLSIDDSSFPEVHTLVDKRMGRENAEDGSEE